MKGFFLNILFLFSFSLLFSQISITDGNGNPINNGDIRIFNSDGDEANLVTLVTNNSSSQIELNLKAVSITGAHGEGMEFCISTCYYGMTSGTVYPTGTAHFYLDAGAVSGANDIHFHHHIQTGDPDVTEYVLKIYEKGNEANNYVQFTYKYDANYVGVDNINNTSFSVYPNPATDILNIRIPENINSPELRLTNIIGKAILKTNLADSKNKINIKNLPAGIYFVTIISNGSIIDTKKLIKK